jgi:WD40 repeat protein
MPRSLTPGSITANGLLPQPLWSMSTEGAPIDINIGNSTAVVVSAEGYATAMDTDSGQIKGQAWIESGLLSCSVSPGGDRAILTGPVGALVWSFSTEELTPIATGHWCAIARWVNKDRFAVAIGRAIHAYDALGNTIWESPTLPSTVTDFAWVGGWRRLAAAVYGGVHLFEARPKGSHVHLPFTGSLLALAVSPHGRWLVSGNQDATLQVFRSDKDTRLEMEGYPIKISQVTFDSSGRWLANDGAPEVSVWDFSSPGPRGRAPIMCGSDAFNWPPTGDDWPLHMDWHPTKPKLAIAWHSGHISVHDPSEGRGGELLRADKCVAEISTSPRGVRWTPDGSSIIFADENGVVQAMPLVEK